MSAFVKLAGAAADDPAAFLLESVEHAERWGRFSFLGRDPALTLVARGQRVEFDGTPPPGVPTDRGALAALEALLHVYRAPTIAELPPFHGGVVGYLGYDVVREIERLPNVPTDALGMPDAVLSVTGHVTAFDHFRQRLYLIENVFLPDPADDAAASDAYDAACARLDARVDELARPLPYVPSPPPAGDLSELPSYTSTMPRGDVPRRGRGGARVHPRRRHLPGRARPALRPRRPLRPVRRVPRAAPGQPVAVHVLRAPSGGDAGRVVARADGAAARRPRRSAAPSPARAVVAAPRPTTGAWRPSCRNTRRSGPST